MADIKLRDRNDNEIPYTGISKLKVPAADGGEDVVFQLPPVMQEKAVTITENGTTSVTPDEGKVLSKVDVTVNVAGGSRAVTPLSETRNVTTDTYLGLLLDATDPDAIYVSSSMISEYITIRATATAGSVSFDSPIFFYGDYDTSLFLQFSGVTGKISFISMAGTVQADYSSDGIVLTPELLDDIKSKTTAYIRTALSLEDLEISYSNPMHVSLVVNGS